MTINEAITRLRDIKPNQYADDVLVGWLSEVEAKIYLENIVWHDDAEQEHPLPYQPEEDKNTVLRIPEPYSNVYIRYMEAQIDYYNGEYIRYANSMTMYNVALSEYADWYNRCHMPRQTYVRM